VASANVIDIGDLCFLHPTSGPKAASGLLDQKDEGLNQDAFQQYFLGVAMGRSRSGDTAKIPFNTAGEHEFACASATFTVGNMVMTYELTTNVLGDQNVVVATEESSAIGVVAKTYASATTKVLVRIRSTIMREALQAQVVGSSSGPI
jgi:hypothetical protein